MSEETYRVRLRRLAYQLCQELSVPEPLPSPAQVEGAPRFSLLDLARILVSTRRGRADFFDARLFGEAAWDILLDLYIAENSRRRSSIKSALIGAAVPPSTALRWIGVLEHRGLIARSGDPQDKRRCYLRLTPAATQAIEDSLLPLQTHLR